MTPDSHSGAIVLGEVVEPHARIWHQRSYGLALVAECRGTPLPTTSPVLSQTGRALA